MRAQTISRRAAAAGFEWEDLDGVWAKVHEEIDELKATQTGSAEAEEELGDLLFTVVNVARKMGIDAETALRRTCEKFAGRFEEMERASSGGGAALEGSPRTSGTDCGRAPSAPGTLARIPASSGATAVPGSGRCTVIRPGQGGRSRRRSGDELHHGHHGAGSP